MSNEFELELEDRPRVQGASKVNDKWFGPSDSPVVVQPDGLQERDGGTIHIDAQDRQLVSLLPRGVRLDQQTTMENKGRDGKIKLFHHTEHQFIRLGVDTQVREMVDGCVLQIANGELGATLPTYGFWDLVGWSHGEGGPENKTQVGFLRVIVGALQSLGGKRLAEVDDAVV